MQRAHAGPASSALSAPSLPSAPHAPSASSAPVGAWLLLIVLLAGLAGASIWHDHRVLGQAPGFTLTSTGLEEGRMGEPVRFSLSDYAGQVVVLDLMAVTCAPCRVVTEEVLAPLHEREREAGRPLAILSIDTWADPAAGGSFGGETARDLREVQNATGVPWRHALDTDRVYQKYTAWQLPRVVVIDPDGRVVFAEAGVPRLRDVALAVDAAWTGQAPQVPLLRVGVAGLAAVAGAASVLSPCSVGLLPAYLGLLLDDARRAAPARRWARALRGGAAAGLGIVAVYALLALLFWWAGDRLRPMLPQVRPVVGAALVLAGVAALWGRTWLRLDRWLGAGRVDARRGFFLFGLAYGLAGFACTGPLFLPLLLHGFLVGPAAGLGLFLAYAAAVAALVVLAAALVAAGEAGRLRPWLERGRWVHRLAALLMAAAGVFLLWDPAGTAWA